MPALKHEPGLVKALAAWNPKCILNPIAVDEKRGWILLPDGGQTLREVLQVEKDVSHWHHILPIYARLQIKMIKHCDDLLQLGILDRRLKVLPGLFQSLLQDKDALLLDQEKGLSQQDYRRISESIPCFASMCLQLAELGIPESLHHDDFHDGNIFYQTGRPVFFDWGESCLAHPFFSMLVGLRSIAYRFEWDAKAPELNQLRDRYLSEWKNFANPDELQKAFSLAQRIGMVNRALTWHLVVSNLEGADREEYADSVPGWLQDFLYSE